LPGIKLAGTRLNLSGLALLALFSCHPALAEETGTGIQAPESSIDPTNVALEGEAQAAAATEPQTAVVAEAETADAAVLDDVWQRIRGGFAIDAAAAENPLVTVHESWFAARPESLQRMVERARPYLYHIVEELDRRAMPMEIALLPMIESAFNPTALSSSAASGIWQFIPSTGRNYGLRQDIWYDGRRDFTAATRAALDYLGKLYLDFGDWQLALAAYNCGEGCVSRAIRKNIQEGLPADYASLSLPTETRHYVPKLLAIKNLMLEPELHGIAVDLLPNQPYFNQVTVHASMDIHSAARLAGISSDEFLALNAAFPRKLIRSDSPVNLLVPVGKTDKFQRNLVAGNWDTWQPYTARKGERLSDIARKFSTSTMRLDEHNQLKLKHGRLRRAQTILVPVKGRGKLAQPARSSQGKQANSRSESIQPVNFTAGAGQSDQLVRYTVKRGDTLFSIARRFDVSLNDLKTWNPAFMKSNNIRAGQTVVIRNS
jgi:membrane-bound lytic murein transglycosylase D